MADFELRHTHVDGVDVIEAVGDLDVATHRRLREMTRELFRTGALEILIDLTETSLLDSVALGALIGARREAYMRRGSLAVVLGTAGAAQRVFELTGMGRAIETFESVEEWRAHRAAT